MATPYTGLITTAHLLIDKFGRDAVLRRGSTSYPIRVVKIEMSPADRAGEFASKVDRKIMLAAKGLTIVPDKETDHVIMEGKTFRLVTPPAETAPGEETLKYDLLLQQVRA